MEKIKKNKEMILSAFIAAVVILALFAAKSIFPFGSGGFDRSGISLPLYMRTYDILHQNASPFFDWYTGGGTGAERYLSGFVVSPYSLLLFFVKRRGVPGAIAFITVLKTALAAAAMSFCIKKTKPAANMAISAVYALSAFVLQYYTNILFLEAAALYPLIFYFIRPMAVSGRVWPYMLLLTAALLISANTLLFILPLTVIYAVIFMHKALARPMRKKFAANLMLYTTAAALLSMVCFYPLISDGALKHTDYAAANSDISAYNGTLDTSRVMRIRHCDAALPANGGEALDRPLLASAKGKESADYTHQMERFGYGFTEKSLLDKGGTAFSDAFLNLTQVISSAPVNERLYTKVGTADGGDIYESRYRFPFGMLMGMNFFITSFPAEGIKMQNLLYNNMTGGFDPIITDVREFLSGESKDQSGSRFTFDIPVQAESTLYARAFGEDAAEYTLFVNGGEYHAVPGSGFIELGTYKNKSIVLDVKTSADDLCGLEIGLLDNTLLEKLTSQYKDRHAENILVYNAEMTMTADMPQEGMIFLPVKFDLNWDASANGEPADIMPVLNNGFMGVMLKKGHSDVRLRYIPKRFYTGAAFGLVGLMLALWAAERRREGLDWADTRLLQGISYLLIYIAAIAAAAGLCLFVYLLFI